MVPNSPSSHGLQTVVDDRRDQLFGHRPLEQSLDPPHAGVDHTSGKAARNHVLADGLELLGAKLPSRGMTVELSEWA